jgi:hypothetical protein
MVLVKMLLVIHLKDSSSWLSAHAKPTQDDLAHVINMLLCMAEIRLSKKLYYQSHTESFLLLSKAISGFGQDSLLFSLNLII